MSSYQVPNILLRSGKNVNIHMTNAALINVVKMQSNIIMKEENNRDRMK